MGKSPKSNWKRTGQLNTPHRVAEFFHSVVAKMVNGEITNNGNQRFGDVVNFQQSFGIEVKSSDNAHSFRISTKQRAAYTERAGFPLERFLYALCGYKNHAWVTKKHPQSKGLRSDKFSMLGRLQLKTEQLEFIAKHVHEIHLFDIEILEALERHHGTQMGLMPAKPDEANLRLRRKDIRPLTITRSRSLNDLGLDSHHYVRAQYHMRVPVIIDEHLYVTEFTLHTVLKRACHKSLLRALSYNEKALP